MKGDPKVPIVGRINVFPRIAVSVFVLLTGLLGIATNARQETLMPATEKHNDDRQEADRKAIKRIMAGAAFKAFVQDSQRFCSDFLKDFSQQKNIRYIKPIVEVDNYEDKRLQAFLTRCPKNDFNVTYVIYHPSMMGELAEAEARGEKITNAYMEELGGIRYQAIGPFRLFRVDIDNDASNGDEYVMYAERYFSQERNAYWRNAYTIIDLEKCEVGPGVYVGRAEDYGKTPHATDYTGIIRYKGRNHIFDLLCNGDNRLILNTYSKKNGNMTSTCGYSKLK